MAEYIEREGLMHELGPYEENNFFQEMSVILQIVAERPAADVGPVVHGRWRPYENEQDKGFHYCSACNCQKFNYEDGSEVVEVLSNYCPNCGAKMDKEESEK